MKAEVFFRNSDTTFINASSLDNKYRVCEEGAMGIKLEKKG